MTYSLPPPPPPSTLAVIVALDALSHVTRNQLREDLQGHIAGFKVGLRTIHDRVGPARIEPHCFMLDAKLHDIPSTMAETVQRLADGGRAPAMLTVHASAGAKALAAVNKVKGSIKIIAVTALTSLDDAACRDVYSLGRRSVTRRLAQTAYDTGCDGIVCSALELDYVAHLGMLKIVPGIRPTWARTADEASDQAAIETPAAAIRLGADYLVVGRPIINAAAYNKTPREAIDAINAEVAGARA